MGKEGREAAKRREQTVIYRRGKNGIYSYRVRFAGRMIHESARTTSKTVAREAERQRRRELEERINGIKKRGLPPTFEIAAKEWMQSRAHAVAKNTFSEGRRFMKHLVPTFGPRLICDINARGSCGLHGGAYNPVPRAGPSIWKLASCERS
jgi:hypothetical protein